MSLFSIGETVIRRLSLDIYLSTLYERTLNEQEQITPTLYIVVALEPDTIQFGMDDTQKYVLEKAATGEQREMAGYELISADAVPGLAQKHGLLTNLENHGIIHPMPEWVRNHYKTWRI